MSTLKVAFYTLGCRANQYDTEWMKEQLKGNYDIVPFDESADIYFVNTCTVTGGADRKSRKYLRRASRKEGLTIAIGCYPTFEPKTVRDLEGVDLVAKNRHKGNIEYVLHQALSGKRGILSGNSDNSIDREEITRDRSHTRAFVKIQDGCNESCSFCRVRYVRGVERSKTPENVVQEIETLAENDFKEIVLTGINLAQYGREDWNLETLLPMVTDVGGIERVRLSSINHTGITNSLIDKFEENEILCPHFHLPLQSGSNRILDRMNRSYTVEDYLDTIERARSRLSQVTFGTDLMVGFPGERVSDFEATKEVLADVNFINHHIFRYSPRQATPAENLDGEVKESVKKRRADELNRLAKQNAAAEKEQFIGEKFNLILEEPSNYTEGWRGYSGNYLDLHLREGKGFNFAEGDLVQARLRSLKDGYFECEIESIGDQ